MSTVVANTSELQSRTSPDSTVECNLSREVLKWLQSLDLAYSIKAVRRDFSNGFLVAEILSRYYPRDFQMHSYANATSIKCKKDNWNLVTKHMRKLNLDDLLQSLNIDGIIHSESDHSVTFIQALYSFLTQRQLNTAIQIPVQLPHINPGFSRETGTSVVRNRLRNSIIAETKDEFSIQRDLESVVHQHEVQLKVEKADNPGRFSANLSVDPSSADNMSQFHNDLKGNQVQVKDISIRHIDKNFSQIRNAKSSVSNGAPTTASNMPLQMIAAGQGKKIGNFSTNSMIPDGITNIVRSAVTRCLHGEDLNRFMGNRDASSDCYTILMNNLQQFNDIGDDVLSVPISEMLNDVDEISAACLSSPMEYLLFSEFIATAISFAPSDSNVFSISTNLFILIAQRMFQVEPTLSLTLYCGWSLPRLVPNLNLTCPEVKRNSVMRITSSFCSHDDANVVRVVNRLKECMSDLPTLISTLSTFCRFLNPYQEYNRLLHALIYYCTIGIEMPQPTIRSSAINIMEFLARNGNRLVALELQNLFFLLTNLMDNEQDNNVIRSYVGFLVSYAPSFRRMGGDSSTNPSEQVLNILNKASSGKSYNSSLIEDIAALSLFYVSNDDNSFSVWSSVFSSMDQNSQKAVCSKIKATEINAPVIINCLSRICAASSFSNGDANGMLSLASCLFECLGKNPHSDMRGIDAVYHGMQQHVVKWIASPHGREFGCTILMNFLKIFPESPVYIRSAAFIGILRVLFENSSADNNKAKEAAKISCQEYFKMAMLSVCKIDNSVKQAVGMSLKDLVSTFGIRLDSSFILQELWSATAN